jgi:hypothetical protein
MVELTVAPLFDGAALLAAGAAGAGLHAVANATTATTIRVYSFVRFILPSCWNLRMQYIGASSPNRYEAIWGLFPVKFQFQFVLFCTMSFDLDRKMSYYDSERFHNLSLFF